MDFLLGENVGIVYLLILGIALTVPFWRYFRQPPEYRQKQETETTSIGGQQIPKIGIIFGALFGINALFILLQWLSDPTTLSQNDIFGSLIAFAIFLVLGKVFWNRYTEQQKKLGKWLLVIFVAVLLMETLLYFLSSVR